MPVSLTVADVIDKNKIASENVWLILLDVDVLDDSGTHVETLRLVDNNENVEYRGETYTAASFKLNASKRANEEPRVTLTAVDVTGVIREKMEDYNGGVGFQVTFTVVNSGNLDADPEIEETFEVSSASAPDVSVEWTLGAENPLKFPYPIRKQYRDRCPWVYKSVRCGYTGAMPSCSFTKEGANGCRAHNNLPRFGGFIGLQNRQ